jgi:hypothetical protein
MRRPPKFVQGFIDRHGKPRFYFRRAGFKPVPLPGLPWAPEFMAAYEDAMAGQPAQIGGNRVKRGTMRALAVSYFNSLGFCSMKSSTQSVYRNIIDRLCEEHGDKRAAHLRREHVVKLMAARAAKPESANGLRKAPRHPSRVVCAQRPSAAARYRATARTPGAPACQLRAVPRIAAISSSVQLWKPSAT